MAESGQVIIQETRLFDAGKNKTFSMRNKEEANDYRYFPEPDLPPLIVDKTEIEEIKSSLPELPRDKKIRFGRHYLLALSDAITLSDDIELADYFEATVQNTKVEAKKAANWILSETMGIVNSDFGRVSKFSERVPPEKPENCLIKSKMEQSAEKPRRMFTQKWPKQAKALRILSKAKV